MKTLQIKRLSTDAKLPTRAHTTDAGLDLYALRACELPPHQPVKIATGIAIALEEGWVGLICDRSSMGSKGVRTLGGVVDAGYRGEIQVVLINLTNTPLAIQQGDKIAQMLVMPVSTCQTVEVTDLDSSSRGAKGFGSSGK